MGTQSEWQNEVVKVGTLNIGGTAVTSTAAELNALDGVTATVAELNLNDGQTATAAEVNNAADVSARVQELTVTGAVTAGVQSVELNHASTIIAATIADAANHQGLFIVKDTSATGTVRNTPLESSSILSLTRSRSNPVVLPPSLRSMRTGSR